ncbi:hypothetical protein E4U45_002601, partial [Claviceps purpurea]
SDEHLLTQRNDESQTGIGGGEIADILLIRFYHVKEEEEIDELTIAIKESCKWGKEAHIL